MKIKLLIILTFFGVIAYAQEPAPSLPSDNDKNWVSTINYNIYGNTVNKGVSLFNDGGKLIENQNWDILTEKVWVSKTFYDQYNRVGLTTMQAPQTSFGTNTNFIKDNLGGFYNHIDFDLPTNSEDPSVVSNSSILGAYYSVNNIENPFQDITSYPFQKNVYSKLNPEKVLRVLGKNKLEGEWRNSYTFTMPASDELLSVFNDIEYSSDNLKVLKTITRDVHGVDTVVFTDLQGNVLATCRSGNEENPMLGSDYRTIDVSEQLYVDIHIPVGIIGEVTINNPYPDDLYLVIFDLITEEESAYSTNTLPSGFYRMFFKKNDSTFEYTQQEGPIQVTYKENYYDFTHNYYDKTNKLISQKQPVVQAETTYKYDSAGRVIEVNSVDEGTTKFKYRRDGQIRYSQNTKQLSQGEFSYTNYDQLGRPIESGVIVSNQFDNSNPNGSLPVGIKKEQFITDYDFIDENELLALGVHTDYQSPTFLESSVAKTYNDHITTYYSYDIYGRTKWVLQNINGLGVKTIDYEYDNSKNVITKVIYQKHSFNEKFIHKYTYSDDSSLIKVETSKDGLTYTKQAVYDYYENKNLKRVELGDNIQGLDYVYNINGQLKAINHHELDGVFDPGGDDNDVFGMVLDYYDGDYQRNNTFQTANQTANISQFNGNINGVSWNVDPVVNQEPVQYKYQYNKNNWLKQADFYSEPSSDYGTNDYQVSNITYDSNGNIQTLKRNKNTENGSNAMDDLTYNYYNLMPNRLKQVQDAVVQNTNADDIKNQISTNNYVYNEIGQLISNAEEGLSYVYNASGLVTEVKKNGNPLVEFYYNDRNQKLKKVVHSPSGVDVTYYVSDLSGQVIGIYNNNTLTEHPIYGLSRVGVHLRNANQTAFQIADHLGNVRAVLLETQSTGRMLAYSNNFEETKSPWIPNNKAIDVSLESGMLKVETDTHLGGVDGVFELSGKTNYRIAIDVIKTNFKEPIEFSVWKGRKLYYSELLKEGRLDTEFAVDESGAYRINFRLNNNEYLGQNIIFYLDNFILQAINTNLLSITDRTDYYPFGMPMPNRNVEGGYRYGYQGEFAEKELELGNGQNSFKLRLWDSRIGRWTSTDPYGQYNSPYLGMGNDPINGVDPDGGFRTRFGAWVYKTIYGIKGEIFENDVYGKWGIDTSDGTYEGGVSMIYGSKWEEDHFFGGFNQMNQSFTVRSGNGARSYEIKWSSPEPLHNSVVKNTPLKTERHSSVETTVSLKNQSAIGTEAINLAKDAAVGRVIGDVSGNSTVGAASGAVAGRYFPTPKLKEEVTRQVIVNNETHHYGVTITKNISKYIYTKDRTKTYYYSSAEGQKSYEYGPIRSELKID